MKKIRHSLKGYKIDYSTNTITMNYKFAKAAQDFGSPEYMLLKDLKADFPMMRTTVEAGRKVTTTNVNKRLTYANIAQHISTYSNREELMNRFETVKLLSKPLASPYKYVCDWFNAQFPNYSDVCVSLESVNEGRGLVELPDVSKYDRKDSALA